MDQNELDLWFKQEPAFFKVVDFWRDPGRWRSPLSPTNCRMTNGDLRDNVFLVRALADVFIARHGLKAWQNQESLALNDGTRLSVEAVLENNGTPDDVRVVAEAWSYMFEDEPLPDFLGGKRNEPQRFTHGGFHEPDEFGEFRDCVRSYRDRYNDELKAVLVAFIDLLRSGEMVAFSAPTSIGAANQIDPAMWDTDFSYLKPRFAFGRWTPGAPLSENPCGTHHLFVERNALTEMLSSGSNIHARRKFEKDWWRNLVLEIHRENEKFGTASYEILVKMIEDRVPVNFADNTGEKRIRALRDAVATLKAETPPGLPVGAFKGGQPRKELVEQFLKGSYKQR